MAHARHLFRAVKIIQLLEPACHAATHFQDLARHHWIRLPTLPADAGAETNLTALIQPIGITADATYTKAQSGRPTKRPGTGILNVMNLRQAFTPRVERSFLIVAAP